MKKEIVKKKENRGGARPGSGPKKSTKQVNIYLDLDLFDFFNQKANKSRYVNELVRKDRDRQVE